MSSSENSERPIAASLAMLLSGAFLTATHGRWVARGGWDWPMVLGGLVISAGALVCMRRRPSLTAVIATQGMLFAVLFSQAFVVGFRSIAFGFQSVAESLVAALISFVGLALSLPLLAPGRTESMFAPLRYRRFLLLGAIACAGSAAIELTSAQYFLWEAMIRSRFDWLAQGCALGLMGFVQAAAVMGLLRMRGIALLGGIASTAIGAVWTATTGHLTLIPHIGCAAIASIAWAIPLLLRETGTPTVSRVRVGVEHDAAAAVELEASDVSSACPGSRLTASR